MNTTSISTRFNAVVAAAVVTLAMLAGIDNLTGHEAPLQLSAVPAQLVKS